MSERHFRLSWRERLRGLLTGCVAEVHADAPPVLVRRYGGGCSIDFSTCATRPEHNWQPRPTIIVWYARREVHP